jgi:hypothetical protein
MKTVLVFVALASIALGGPMAAQEEKPVPKDSDRVFIPGCTKGLILTAGPRTEDQGARLDIPEGMHFRMQGPKKMMAEIKAHEGSMVGITGLIKKGQHGPSGVGIAPGVRIMPGGSPTAGGGPRDAGVEQQTVIDVESWRLVVGSCRSR